MASRKWWQFWVQPPHEQPAPVEAKSPKPSEELPFIEPIGFGSEINPLDKKDRKNPAALVQAALQAAQTKSRQARYTDFDNMDQSDIAAMLDAVVDAVLTFDDVSRGRGFLVESDDKNIQELLRLAQQQADLDSLAEEVLRDFCKYGDGFTEPLFAGPTLVGCQTYNPEEIYVTRDDKGRLATGKDDDGYPVAFQQKRNGQVVAGWNPWEMVHFKFAPTRKLLYSRVGLLDGLRADWRKLQLVEQGMVVARIARAYPKRVHYVDVTGKNREDQESTLRAYIRRMMQKNFGKKTTNDDGLPIVDVSDDLFVSTGYMTGPDGKPYPMLNKTEIEDPATAGLSELADVVYLRQKVWSQVPSDVVGIKRNLTSEMDNQDYAFARLIRRCQRQLEVGLRGIFDQVLLANGKLPSQVPYKIVFPSADVKASWKYADARYRTSMELRNYVELGALSRRSMLKRALNLTDDEIDVMFKELEDEMNNPIFQALATLGAARNGMPTTGTGGGKDGSQPTATTTTGTGVNRGTKLGQQNRGNMSGG